MNGNPQLPAFVRTYVPLIVTVLGTWLAKHGFNVDGAVLQALVGAVLGGLYYALVRLLEAHRAEFGWLLGVAKQPAYAPGPPPAPDTGQDVVAGVVKDATDVADGQAPPTVGD